VAKPLTEHVALVTGAASGIGRETALALVNLGACVAVVDRDGAGASKVASEAERAGGTAKPFPADLAEDAGLVPLVRRVVDAFGHIDILVNCAGTSGVAGQRQSSFDFTDEAFETVMALNLRAPFVLTREVGRHLIERGQGGRIVNVSSSAAFQAKNVPPIYAASKAALNALTRVSAADLAPHGVNVNAVAPGVTKTGMIGMELTDEQYDALVSSGPHENLTHHASDAGDVASVICFLCLPASSQITGQVIHTSAGAVV
jgi:NAD(P)-dependent dehydrogenase (short-subunit alcohol dehydrogenase family)